MDYKLELISFPVSDVDPKFVHFADPDGNGWDLQEPVYPDGSE
jgi:hypothetical protein